MIKFFSSIFLKPSPLSTCSHALSQWIEIAVHLYIPSLMCCLSAGCQLRHWPNQSVSHRSVYPYSANQPHPPTPLPALDLCATGGLTPPSTFWPALIMSRDKSCLIVITEAVTQEHRSVQTTHWNQIYSRRRKAAALLMLVFITCWLSVRINC